MSRITYQKAQNELNNILKKLENGEVEIDELNKVLKRASELIKLCRAKLRDTEEAIEGLSADLDGNQP